MRSSTNPYQSELERQRRQHRQLLSNLAATGPNSEEKMRLAAEQLGQVNRTFQSLSQFANSNLGGAHVDIHLMRLSTSLLSMYAGYANYQVPPADLRRVENLAGGTDYVDPNSQILFQTNRNGVIIWNRAILRAQRAINNNLDERKPIQVIIDGRCAKKWFVFQEATTPR